MKEINQRRLISNAPFVVGIIFNLIECSSSIYIFPFLVYKGKRMKHVNSHKLHMRSHRDSSGNVTDSVNVSESKKQYLCSICGRACTSRSNLAVHTRRHNGTMTNFCKICGKGYPRSTDLTVHMRQHTGEKPFVCSTCNRGFTRSDKLTIHMR